MIQVLPFQEAQPTLRAQSLRLLASSNLSAGPFAGDVLTEIVANVATEAAKKAMGIQ